MGRPAKSQLGPRAVAVPVAVIETPDAPRTPLGRPIAWGARKPTHCQECGVFVPAKARNLHLTFFRKKYRCDECLLTPS